MKNANLSILKRILIGCALCAAAWQAQAQAQRTFPSPEDAAKALVAAAAADDEAAMAQIFGPQYRTVVATDDKAQGRENRAKFASAAKEYQLLRKEKDGRVTLVVGTQAWPLPVPLVQSGGAWRFDTAAGVEELQARRIGENELGAIEVLQFYVGAQRQYATVPRDGSNVRAFAQRLTSTAGKKDGLYWESAAGEEQSPIGPLVGDGDHVAGEPYHGYHYRILKAQGPAAPGGRYSYVINGRMVAGYALMAWPARYGNTGVKTFIVNHYGQVYEKDLGPNTAQLAAGIKEYNPDKTWSPVGD
ncbi:DUF2950 domain-containing protein [Ramlibacter sp. XY19]|uniref:DUF2950 domain-containing protein n=1 Tax=Ramlibacter paludis TaxID=2908000 RepID=UPI0023DAEA55|nr:DUF2950 domain-containing protein [Ramlibacter paludis]MCG2595469.1 DUF2950 domain-containing protein [Ramlibacter paludis]